MRVLYNIIFLLHNLLLIEEILLKKSVHLLHLLDKNEFE